MPFYSPGLHRCISSNKVLPAQSPWQRSLLPTAAGLRDLTLLAKVHFCASTETTANKASVYDGKSFPFFPLEKSFVRLVGLF